MTKTKVALIYENGATSSFATTSTKSEVEKAFLDAADSKAEVLLFQAIDEKEAGKELSIVVYVNKLTNVMLMTDKVPEKRQSFDALGAPVKE